ERFPGPPQVAGATEGEQLFNDSTTRYSYEILCRFDRKSIRLSEFAGRACYRFRTSATPRRSHDRATGKTRDAACAGGHLPPGNLTANDLAVWRLHELPGECPSEWKQHRRRRCQRAVHFS